MAINLGSLSRKKRRRHLYTDEDRVTTSIGLLSSLNTGSVDNSLQKLDGWDSLPPGQSSFLGPFGVFSLQDTRTSTTTTTTNPMPLPLSSGCGTGPPPNPPPGFNPDPIRLPLVLPSSILADFSAELITVEESLHWPDLFDMDLAWPDLRLEEDSNSLLPEMVVADEKTQHKETGLLKGTLHLAASDFFLGEDPNLRGSNPPQAISRCGGRPLLLISLVRGITLGITER